MTWSLLASTSFYAPTVTSPAIDTVGADLLIASVGMYASSGTTGTLSDSAGNTWTIGENEFAGSHRCALFYVPKPVKTSASHTLTLSGGTSSFWFIVFTAWSGSGAAPLDQTNGIAPTGTATSIQPGSITPTANGELIVSALQVYSASTAPTIDSGFTIVAADAGSGHYGGGLAYLEQATAAAVNPTWSWTSACQSPCVIASFKPGAAVAAAYPFRRNRTYLGR